MTFEDWAATRGYELDEQGRITFECKHDCYECQREAAKDGLKVIGYSQGSLFDEGRTYYVEEPKPRRKGAKRE
jgi:hypothetical protein